MKKGQKKRIWTKKQKLEIKDKYLNEHTSAGMLSKENNADKSMLCRWIRNYGKYGESAFNAKGHSGNPFAALHTSKTLSETKRLRLQLLKLELENERFKKGYQVKGVCVNKEYVFLKDANMK